MKTLEAAIRCKQITDELMRINQSAYVRNENLKPISVNWDLEKQSDVFKKICALQNDLASIIYLLNQL